MSATPRWLTSSLGSDAETSPAELTSLEAHVRDCHRRSGRLFTLRCAGELLQRFLAAHIVTTLLLAAALVGGIALLH